MTGLRQRASGRAARDVPQPSPGGSGVGYSQSLWEKAGGDVTGCSAMTATQRLPAAALTNAVLRSASAPGCVPQCQHRHGQRCQGCPPSSSSTKPAATCASLGLSSRHQSSTTVPSGNFILCCGFFVVFFFFFSLKRLKRRFGRWVEPGLFPEKSVTL